jgi:hypothetical protein
MEPTFSSDCVHKHKALSFLALKGAPHQLGQVVGGGGAPAQELEGPALLPDTKPREDHAQQIICAKLTCDAIQRLLSEPEFFCKQIQHFIASLRVRMRNRQMLAGLT